DFAARHFLAWLVAGRHRGLGMAFDALNLEAADRHWSALIGNVDHPDEGRDLVPSPLHVLVGHNKVLAASDGARQRECGVRRTGERGAPVEARQQAWAGEIIDIEDDEAALPVAGVEPVTQAQGVMAAVRVPVPARRFAPRRPLSGLPPAPDLLRPLRF